MAQTLVSGKHKLVFTRQVNDCVAEDSKFAAFVWKSLLRFNRGDWGDVADEDWKANDETLKSLNADYKEGCTRHSGGWNGRILAVYCNYGDSGKILEWKIYIIRNTAEVDGTQAITVLFPDEY